MVFDERRFERFAMKLEEMSQGSTPATDGIVIDEVSDALGMSLEDGRELAQWLHDSGWAIQKYSWPEAETSIDLQGLPGNSFSSPSSVEAMGRPASDNHERFLDDGYLDCCRHHLHRHHFLLVEGPMSRPCSL